MFYSFVVGDDTYNLKLTTKSIVALEKRIGSNPLMIFGLDGNIIPTIGVMVEILHASLTPMNHSITMDDTYKIFDRWLEDGHIPTDFIKVIIEIYQISGLMKKPTDKSEDNEKNA